MASGTRKRVRRSEQLRASISHSHFALRGLRGHPTCAAFSQVVECQHIRMIPGAWRGPKPSKWKATASTAFAAHFENSCL